MSDDNRPSVTKPISTGTTQKPPIPRPAPLGNTLTHSLHKEETSTHKLVSNNKGGK